MDKEKLAPSIERRITSIQPVYVGRPAGVRIWWEDGSETHRYVKQKITSQQLTTGVQKVSSFLDSFLARVIHFWRRNHFLSRANDLPYLSTRRFP